MRTSSTIVQRQQRHYSVTAVARSFLTKHHTFTSPASHANTYRARFITCARQCVAVRGIARSCHVCASTKQQIEGGIGFKGLHHVALICENLERSMEFYQGLLGLAINPDRPHDKLPYRGAWLWVGPEMIHLMELPNPDPLVGRPEHGGRDRHFCVGVDSIATITPRLDAAGIPYTMSKSGRAAIFFRDPDMNTIECVELESWR